MNDGADATDALVRVKWYQDIAKRGRTYYQDKAAASNRELNQKC